uniref:Uncharacterized protein n=1 Tax=Salix viminalis TaxID=40686 RepID=A0A6N2K7Z8_SALVM
MHLSMHSIFHGNDPKHHPTQAKISFQSTFLGGGVAKCPALVSQILMSLSFHCFSSASLRTAWTVMKAY